MGSDGEGWKYFFWLWRLLGVFLVLFGYFFSILCNWGGGVGLGGVEEMEEVEEGKTAEEVVQCDLF